MTDSEHRRSLWLGLHPGCVFLCKHGRTFPNQCLRWLLITSDSTFRLFLLGLCACLCHQAEGDRQTLIIARRGNWRRQDEIHIEVGDR